MSLRNTNVVLNCPLVVFSLAGGVSVVLAQDRDRFAREPAYLYLLKEEFEHYRTKIRSLSDRDDDSPEGELTDGILDQLAKFERAKTTERTRRGKLQKARQGKVVAGPRPNFGFKYNASRDNYVVDEEQMRIIKRIFREVGVRDEPCTPSRRHSTGKVCRPRRGGRFWSLKYIRDRINDNVYRPTRLRRSQPWLNQEWRPSSTLPRATGCGSSTDADTKHGKSRRADRTANAATVAKAMCARSPTRSGLPCRCRTPAYPESRWTPPGKPSKTMPSPPSTPSASGNSQVASFFAASAGVGWSLTAPPTRARGKARAVAEGSEEIVLAADTVVYLPAERRILGQAKSEEEVRRTLRLLRARIHEVHSGVAVVRGEDLAVRHAATRVRMRALGEAEVEAYARLGEGVGKAGGTRSRAGPRSSWSGSGVTTLMWWGYRSR